MVPSPSSPVSPVSLLPTAVADVNSPPKIFLAPTAFNLQTQSSVMAIPTGAPQNAQASTAATPVLSSGPSVTVPALPPDDPTSFVPTAPPRYQDPFSSLAPFQRANSVSVLGSVLRPAFSPAPTQDSTVAAESPESIVKPTSEPSSPQSMATTPGQLSESPQRQIVVPGPGTSQGNSPEGSMRSNVLSPAELAPADADATANFTPSTSPGPLSDPEARVMVDSPGNVTTQELPNAPGPSPSSIKASEAISLNSTAPVSPPFKLKDIEAPSPLNLAVVSGPGPASLRPLSSLAPEVSPPKQDLVVATEMPESIPTPSTDVSSSQTMASPPQTQSESPQQPRQSVSKASGPGTSQGKAPDSTMTPAALSPFTGIPPSNAGAGFVQSRSPGPMADPIFETTADNLTAPGRAVYVSSDVTASSPSSTLNSGPSVEPSSMSDAIESPSPQYPAQESDYGPAVSASFRPPISLATEMSYPSLPTSDFAVATPESILAPETAFFASRDMAPLPELLSESPQQSRENSVEVSRPGTSQGKAPASLMTVDDFSPFSGMAPANVAAEFIQGKSPGPLESPSVGPLADNLTAPGLSISPDGPGPSASSTFNSAPSVEPSSVSEEIESPSPQNPALGSEHGPASLRTPTSLAPELSAPTQDFAAATAMPTPESNMTPEIALSASRDMAPPPELMSESPQQSRESVVEVSRPGTSQGKAPESVLKVDGLSPFSDMAPADVAAELIQSTSPGPEASPSVEPLANNRDSLTTPSVSEFPNAPIFSPSSTGDQELSNVTTIFLVSTTPVGSPTKEEENETPSPSNLAAVSELGPASLGPSSSVAPTQYFTGAADMPEKLPALATDLSSSKIIASPPDLMSKSPQQPGQRGLGASVPGTTQGKPPESSTRLDAMSPTNEFAPASVAAEIIQDRSPGSGASPLLGPMADSRDISTAPGILEYPDATTPSPSNTGGQEPSDATRFFSVSTAPTRPPTKAQEIDSPSPSKLALENEERPASLGPSSSLAPELFTPTQNSTGAAGMPESIPAPGTVKGKPIGELPDSLLYSIYAQFIQATETHPVASFPLPIKGSRLHGHHKTEKNHATLMTKLSCQEHTVQWIQSK